MRITGTFYFDPEDEIYKDHFPGNPVVPGSVIIHGFCSAVNKHINQHVGGNSDLISVQGFRFKRFISPGSYEYTLSMNKTFVECRLFDNAKTVVTGKIVTGKVFYET